MLASEGVFCVSDRLFGKLIVNWQRERLLGINLYPKFRKWGLFGCSLLLFPNLLDLMLSFVFFFLTSVDLFAFCDIDQCRSSSFRRVLIGLMKSSSVSVDLSSSFSKDLLTCSFEGDQCKFCSYYELCFCWKVDQCNSCFTLKRLLSYLSKVCILCNWILRMCSYSKILILSVVSGLVP